MIRPGTFLILWGVLMLLFGGMWMRTVPPGGVSWPFFSLVVTIPVGAVHARRRGAAAWQVALYALIAGAFFAAGVAFDGRHGLRVRSGLNTEFRLWFRFGVVAAAFWITTALVTACLCRSRDQSKSTEGESDGAGKSNRAGQ